MPYHSSSAQAGLQAASACVVPSRDIRGGDLNPYRPPNEPRTHFQPLRAHQPPNLPTLARTRFANAYAYTSATEAMALARSGVPHAGTCSRSGHADSEKGMYCGTSPPLQAAERRLAWSTTMRPYLCCMNCYWYVCRDRGCMSLYVPCVS